MRATGNAMSRRVWEGTYKPGNSSGMTMIRPSGPGEVERKKQWCIEKYVKKRYLGYLESDDDLGYELHAACKYQVFMLHVFVFWVTYKDMLYIYIFSPPTFCC
jgi:hypothetical protein